MKVYSDTASPWADGQPYVVRPFGVRMDESFVSMAWNEGV